MRKVHGTLHVKIITCPGCARVAAAGHWNTEEPVSKEFCGSWPEQHRLAPVPTGVKEREGQRIS